VNWFDWLVLLLAIASGACRDGMAMHDAAPSDGSIFDSVVIGDEGTEDFGQGPGDAGVLDVFDSSVSKRECGVDPSEIESGSYLSETFGLEFLAARQIWPRSIALLEGRLYWGEAYFTGGSVRSVDTVGCGLATVSMGADSRHVSTDGYRVYWLENARLRVFDPGSGRVERFDTLLNAGLVLTSSAIFSAGGTPCVLESAPYDGGASRVVTATASGVGVAATLVGSEIAFACTRPAAIFLYDVADDSVRRLVTRPREITAMATTSTAVVWGEDACHDFAAACPMGVEPGCCAGRVLKFDLVTGLTSTVAEDPLSRPFAIAVDDGQIYWSNFSEVRRAKTGTTSGELVADRVARVEGFAFDHQFIYWSAPNFFSDTVQQTGVIVKAPKRRR
jgi:hypothetical protein